MDAKLTNKIVETVVYVVIIIVAAGVLLAGNGSVVPFLYFGALVSMFIFKEHSGNLMLVAIFIPVIEAAVLFTIAWFKPGNMPEIKTIVSQSFFYAKATMGVSYIFWCLVLPIVTHRAAKLWGK